MNNKLVTRQVTYIGICLLLVFYGWMLFSLSYTTSNNYSTTKAFYFALNIIGFSIPFLLKGFRIKLFLKWFTASVIFLALALLPFLFFMGKVWETEAFKGYEAISGLYLSLSGYLGLIVVLFLTSKEPFFKSRVRDRIFVIGLVLLMLLLGARGPLIFALFVFGISYLYNLERIKLAIGRQALSYLVAGAFIGVVTLVVMLQFEATESLLNRTFGRLFKLVAGIFTGNYNDASALTRVELFKDALAGIFAGLGQNLTGYGIGSFGIETMGEDFRLYPHNMILEIWFELGFIGLILFFGWIVFLLSKTVRLPYKYVSYWVLLYFFLNLMKSSSLVDIRTEFAFLGIFVTQFFLKTENCALKTI